MPLEKATGQDKKLQDRLLQAGEIPQHIAIIMDGNGRWAKRRGMPRIAGHHEGVNSVRDIVEACGQLGVKYLTLYAFSTENWNRPKHEVSLLMRLLLRALRDERDRLHQNEVQLKAIGDIAKLPQDVQDELLDAIKLMEDNRGLTLVLALSYSGRWDITNAIRRMAEDVRLGIVKPASVTEDLLASYLSTKDIPDPDLLVRTSGELRISNFLLWQLAYSELFISDEYWPSFRRKQLYSAIAEFQKRERRFGKVSEQIRKRQGSLEYVERFLKSVSKL
ncbi:MAG: isoprenyl transferase [Ignavibacteriales bacterium]|nr:isoprenyl transferase [Ignavibacteriales bacterium]